MILDSEAGVSEEAVGLWRWIMGRSGSSWLISAKPERGEIFGMMRIVDLCPPSGADLCT